jgi:hypothetical protein
LRLSLETSRYSEFEQRTPQRIKGHGWQRDNRQGKAQSREAQLRKFEGYVTRRLSKSVRDVYVIEKFGRGEWIRTTGLLVPNNERKKNQ